MPQDNKSSTIDHDVDVAQLKPKTNKLRFHKSQKALSKAQKQQEAQIARANKMANQRKGRKTVFSRKHERAFEVRKTA